jgi:predicted acetyltransferase
LLSYKLSISIKTISPDNEEGIKIINQIAMYAFNESPQETSYLKRLRASKFREYSVQYLVTFNDQLVVTGTIHSLTQNLRNKTVKMGGVATISSLPEVRRKGLVKKLIIEMFQKMREDNQVVSCLVPFRESFYEDIGYINFPQWEWIELDIKNLEKIPSLDTKIHYVRNQGKILSKEFYNYLQEIVEANHGFVCFDQLKFQEIYEETNHWIMLVKEDKQTIGAIMYRITGWEEQMILPYLYYSDLKALIGILNWLKLHFNQVKSVKFLIPKHINLELLFTDLKIKKQSYQSAMGRIIDVSKLNGLTVSKGKIQLQIADEQCPWNNKIWIFECQDGKLVVEDNQPEPSERNSDLALVTIQGLSALVYGCYDEEVLKIRSWIKATTVDFQTLITMFPKKDPFMNEDF